MAQKTYRNGCKREIKLKSRNPIYLALLQRQVVLMVKNPPAKCRKRKRCGFDPWVRKIPWRRKWQSTPVLLPGKSHGQGAWWAAVYGVMQSRTQLSDFTFSFHFHALEKEMATHSSVHSCLENPRGGEVWWAAVYGVAQSRTQLKRLSSNLC